MACVPAPPTAAAARITQELDGLAPRAAVVLIGTNNLGNGFTPEEAAEGVAAVARDVLRRLPGARVAVTLLLPRTPAPEDAAEGRWDRWEARPGAGGRISLGVGSRW